MELTHPEEELALVPQQNRFVDVGKALVMRLLSSKYLLGMNVNGSPIIAQRKGCSLKAVVLNRSDLSPLHLPPRDTEQC